MEGAGWRGGGGGGGSPFRTALAATRCPKVLCRAVDMLMDTSLVLYQYIYCSLHETSLPTLNEILTN